MELTKNCNKCGVEKIFNAENFVRQSSNKSGLAGTCRECKQIHDRKRRANLKSKFKNKTRTRPINPATGNPYIKGEKVGDRYVCMLWHYYFYVFS